MPVRHCLVPLLLFSLGVCPAWAADGPVAHWRFDSGHTVEQTVADLAGHAPATITGPVKFGGTAASESLLINKADNLVSLPYDLAQPALPQEAITVEAWVCVEQTVEFCNILGAMQDNGGYQKGFMLGFRQSNFCFGLSSAKADDGDGLITWVRDRESLQWGRWYHVAGTYDGARLCLYVDGRLVDESDKQSGPINYPAAASYLIGALADDDSKFYWRGWIREAAVYDRGLSADEIRARYDAARDQFPTRLHVAVGPWVERLGRDRMRVSWRTEYPSPTRLVFGDDITALETKESPGLATDHQIEIGGIEPKQMYFYRLAFQDVEGALHWTRLHEYDSTYGFWDLDIQPGPFPYASAEEQARYGAIADRLIKEAGVDKGYALIIGNGEGRLAYELAVRSRLKVVALDDDAERIRRVRKALDEAGLYGVRVTIHEGRLAELPYGYYFANLVTSESMLEDGRPPCTKEEMFRVLHPNGGLLMLGYRNAADPAEAEHFGKRRERWMNTPEAPEMADTAEGETGWMSCRRPALPGSAEWTHQYANPANTTCSGDALPGKDMRPLWFGGPGPRPMTDRGTRAPAPLYADGRMYVQGDCRLFGLDAYNGTILWELDFPDLRRANVPRGSSNMAAGGPTLYAVVREKCLLIDGRTGGITATCDVPEPAAVSRHDWGYVAVQDGLLYGTAVKRGGLFIGADGEWYDTKGDESEKTVSEVLFAMNKNTGESVWTYQGGAVIDSTLTIGGGRVYFVESRNPALAALDSGRFGDEIMEDRFLVALDAEDGSLLWEQPWAQAPAVYVHYLMYSDEKLVSVSSSDEWNVFCLNAVDGSQRWERKYHWNRDNHGGTIQHPAIVAGKIYAEPCLLALDSGEVAKDDILGRGGCGTVSAAGHAILFRDGTHTIWDLNTDRREKWADLRPGCWLGIIPAGGLVLAPESSAGCWCSGTPMQTSIAFALPEAREP